MDQSPPGGRGRPEPDGQRRPEPDGVDPLEPDGVDPLEPDGVDPLDPRDDGDAALEAALADPAFDELPAVQDPGRPEDPFGEPGAPHLALDEAQGEGSDTA